MAQLHVLSGKHRGAAQAVHRFPYLIGRGSSAHWRLDDSGIWDRHLQLDFQPGEGITLTVLPGAIAAVNGQPADRTLLRNGDTVDLGGTKLQFWLAETRQYNFRLREIFTWTGFVLLCVFQLFLIYYLLP